MPMPPSTGKPAPVMKRAASRTQEHGGVGDFRHLGEPAERGLLDDACDRRVDVGRKADGHDVLGELHPHLGWRSGRDRCN